MFCLKLTYLQITGWYSTGSYFWAKTVVELPLCLLITFFYCLLIYIQSNQINELFRQLGFLSVLIAGSLIAQGNGFAVGTAANTNDKLAISLAVGSYLYMVLLCGFFAPIDELPKGIRWICHLAYVKQSYEMIIYILYGFQRCPEGQVALTLLMTDTDNQDQFWINAVILVFQVIFFRLVALFIMLFKANSQKIARLAGSLKNKKNI